MERRSFLKTTGLFAAGSMLPGLSNAESLFTFANKYPPVGLQVYTINFMFSAPGADAKAVLKQIADIGVKELETATGANGLYYGFKPKEFAAMANDAGLKWIGNHIGGLPRTPARPAGSPPPANGRVPSWNLRDNVQQIVDDAAEGGCSWVVCSGSSENTFDEIKRTTEVFVKAGELSRKAKMRFAYHNHEGEFKKIDGTSAYEYILGQTNKKEVYMEVDLAWATAAGMDPVQMFNDYPGRFPLWHVKDLDKTTGKPCPVGSGKVDIARVFANSKKSGVEHTFIEQDGAKSISEPASSVQWLNSNVYKK